MDIREAEPIDAFFQVLDLGVNGESLLIETDLRLLDQDFVSRYSKEFSWHFKDSQRSLLTPDISNPDFEFSYFNRIHNHFGFDQLYFVLGGLKKGSRSRIISTWDPKVDMETKALIPCLVVLKLSISDRNELDLGVVFRSRDIMKRMIPNWVALDVFQRNCADLIGLKQGILSDYSLQWFYRHDDLQRLKGIL